MDLSHLLPEETVLVCQNFSQTLASCSNLDSIMRFKGAFIGRENSHISRLFDLLKVTPKESKKELGIAINLIKNQWEAAIKERLIELELEHKKTLITHQHWDSTLTPPLPTKGSIHPLFRLMNYIVDIFRPLGFHVEEGPEVETEEYNFDSLNIPSDHPARGTTDTFYFRNNKKLILRTHTSSVQVHVLRKIGKRNSNGVSELESAGGIKFLAPGRVYRKDEVDPTHSPMFHQIEGMVIGHMLGMHHLKGTLNYAMKSLFGQNSKLRFRPSYFSFVEPGVEVDLWCYFCNGCGCRICKGSGWIELLGAGLVHPNVLNLAGIDSSIWSGFAFGMGVERIAMMMSETPDLRFFFENDQRFLEVMEGLE